MTNKMADVAKLLGIELDEEFKITECELYYSDDLYKITQKGLVNESDVAKLLGIELDEEFKITECELYYSDGLYKITQKGLVNESDDTCSALLTWLIRGKCKIVKQPWKPKCGEIVWLTLLTSQYKVSYCYWTETKTDQDYYERGLVFKTEEEAIEMYDKIINFIKGGK